MATKRKKKTEARLQYSKKLATSITIIWCVLRFAVMISSIIEPSIADAMVKLIAGADTVMMINLGFYSGNSVAEKGILAWLDAQVAIAKNDNEDDEEDAVG